MNTNGQLKESLSAAANILRDSAVDWMNLVLHGIEDFKIEREDTLRAPAFTDS